MAISPEFLRAFVKRLFLREAVLVTHFLASKGEHVPASPVHF